MTTPIIRPRNWHEFQHYHDRKPVWIKLHRSLLDDYEFQSLSVEARALAPMLWLIASDDENGHFDHDVNKIAFRLRTKPAEVQKHIAKPLAELMRARFFEPVFTDPLAEPEQPASSEKETETETEAERETETESMAGTTKRVFEYWRNVMNHHRSQLDEKRRKAIRAAIKMGYSEDDLRRAIDGCRNSPFHMGENDRNARYDELTLILRDASHIDRFIRQASEAPSRLGRSGNRTAAAANNWLKTGEQP